MTSRGDVVKFVWVQFHRSNEKADTLTKEEVTLSAISNSNLIRVGSSKGKLWTSDSKSGLENISKYFAFQPFWTDVLPHGLETIPFSKAEADSCHIDRILCNRRLDNIGIIQTPFCSKFLTYKTVEHIFFLVQSTKKVGEFLSNSYPYRYLPFAIISPDGIWNSLFHFIWI